MNFKLDENVPVSLGELFKSAGHDVATANEEGLVGAEDAQLLRIASRERRALVTLDMGFADLRRLSQIEHAGIVVIRLRDQNRAAVARVGLRFVNSPIPTALDGCIVVADEARVRVRRTGGPR